jgi:hypothetical protein
LIVPSAWFLASNHQFTSPDTLNPNSSATSFGASRARKDLATCSAAPPPARAAI